MRVLILGVGDAFTTTHYNSCALLHGPAGYALIDCPDLIHRALKEACAAAGWRVAADNIDDILLTHLHGDHANGLESFGFSQWVALKTGRRAAPPRLHTSAPAADRLWERLAPAMDTLIGVDRRMRLDDFFDVRILTPGQPADVAGLRVDCRFTTHHIPTLGFLFREGRRAFGWSGDTRFDPEHARWLDAADLIVHETSPLPAHAPIEDLNTLPAAWRAKTRLMHLPDAFDPACTDMRPLREGEVLEV